MRLRMGFGIASLLRRVEKRGQFSCSVGRRDRGVLARFRLERCRVILNCNLNANFDLLLAERET
jgi:hypothetical protein